VASQSQSDGVRNEGRLKMATGEGEVTSVGAQTRRGKEEKGKDGSVSKIGMGAVEEH